MDSADEWDEWFDESITRYGRLLMFDFATPVKHLDVINVESICLAHEEKHERNEIVNLKMPEKLLASKDKESSARETDFKMQSGGFTEKPLSEIQVLYEKNVVLSSEKGQYGVSVYNLQSENTDIIKYSNTINFDLLAPRLTYNKTNLVATVGTNKQECFLIDTNATFCVNRVILHINESVEHPIKATFVSSNILGLCDTKNGSMRLYDIRAKCTVAYFEPGQFTHDSQWTVSSSFLSSPDIHDSSDDTKIGLLSASGTLSLHDIRNMQKPLNSENIKKDLLDMHNSESLPINLKYSPFNSSVISVSGFNSNVYVYNTMSENMTQVFVHDAHAKLNNQNQISLVTDHLWYKTIIISACENLSVHCWECSI